VSAFFDRLEALRPHVSLTPHLFAVNAKPDLVANIGRALAKGLLALAP
jgi:hypothetical protein